MQSKINSSSTPAISFLGPISSYTHQAALGRFDKEKYEYQPAVGIPDVFEAVQSGKAELGVVPFENSTNGAVIFTLELLADRHSLYKDVTICGEAYLDVSHCLLGYVSTADSPVMSGTCTPTTSTPSPVKPKTTPLSSLNHIQRIYTHPQAYGQCEAFLGTYLKGVERLDVSSTSKAAEIVKADKSGTSAAIASSLAADIHKLDILAKGIEDRDDNTTRFLILRKGVDASATKVDVAAKSMVTFTIDHRTPGALADVLDCFRRYQVNLTSINSRPTKVVPFQYIFFVEFEGNLSLPYTTTLGDECSDTALLPQSHHLVYFSPQIPHSALLPDGTDPLQSPGPPFVRRMWAGGSLVFNTTSGEQLRLDNMRAACIERIVDVSVRGREGDEKVFVNIERRVGLADTGDEHQIDPDAESSAIASGKGSVSDRNYMADQRLLQRHRVDNNDNIGQASLVETRNIVFMREKDTATAKEDCARLPKILRPTRKPDFDVRITPTQSLLFRFSALTFNAHAIHLDPQYCREFEGYRNLLLHGPLSLVLMFSVLRSQLQPGEIIKRFNYRNLAPLYANEELRVCVGKDADKSNKYEVWIEGKEGGYAVKGSAVVGPLDTVDS
ncbi:putative chorismate mutase prephenate dehydratase protein [Botrytis cinerea BcDW1]|nr:putative chorismate mutase prephenate dehydratase protein [Botrytis cinerea BcDW1]